MLELAPRVDATQDQSSSKAQLIINNLRFDRPAPVRLLRNAFLVEDARRTLTTRGFYAVPTALDRRGLTRLAPRVAVAPPHAGLRGSSPSTGRSIRRQRHSPPITP